MNGIKCYLSRAEVKKILADEVAKRLEPERLLGTCLREATLYDDGRVEVMFWTPESALGQEAQREAAAEKEREAKDTKDVKDAETSLISLSILSVLCPSRLAPLSRTPRTTPCRSTAGRCGLPKRRCWRRR